MKKNTISTVLFAACAYLLVGVTSPALGQSCSESDKSGVAGCIEESSIACEALTSNCSSYEVSVSIEDVKRDVSESCCDNERSRSRRNCLRRALRRYRQASSRARGLEIRDFLRSATDTVRELRATDCGDQAYADLF